MQSGMDAFQECDTVGITRPCVKHNFLVKDVKDLALTIKKAFYIATTGRPGPVLVDIPKDVTPPSASSSIRKRSRCAPTTRWSRATRADQEGGATAAGGQAPDDLRRRRRDSVRRAPQLTKLVRTLGFPCTNTLMGLGGYPATDQQFVGMLGMHGTYEANMAMQNCDVLLAIGARFDDRVIGNPAHFAQVQRKIIHIDIDPSSISKRVKVDMPIVGHVPDVLDEMIKLIEAASSGRSRRRSRPGGTRSRSGDARTACATTAGARSSSRST